VNNNLELVNSRHSSEPEKLKEPGKHLIFPNSKASVTSNRFSMLADIESGRRDEVLISTEEQDTFNVIDKRLRGANKPKTAPVKQTWGGHNLTTLLPNLQDRERKTRRRRG
jgi:hypothetical protein